jgi:hypothetical protein
MRSIAVIIFVALMLMLMLHHTHLNDSSDAGSIKSQMLRLFSPSVNINSISATESPNIAAISITEAADVATSMATSVVNLYDYSLKVRHNNNDISFLKDKISNDVKNGGVVPTILQPKEIRSSASSSFTSTTASSFRSARKEMKKPKYAYITLLHGIDKSNKYKGFLLNTLIMRAALTRVGSKHDLIAMIGFTDLNTNVSEFEIDINLLKAYNVKVHLLPRMTTSKNKISFAEMALLKITPWSLLEYDR